jgi:hypothetical protein
VAVGEGLLVSGALVVVDLTGAGGASGSAYRGIGAFVCSASAVGSASPATHSFHDMFESAMPGSVVWTAALLL